MCGFRRGILTRPTRKPILPTIVVVVPATTKEMGTTPRAVLLKGPTLNSKVFMTAMPERHEDLVSKACELFKVPADHTPQLYVACQASVGTMHSEQRGALLLADAMPFLRDRELITLRWVPSDSFRREKEGHVQWDPRLDDTRPLTMAPHVRPQPMPLWRGPQARAMHVARVLERERTNVPSSQDDLPRKPLARSEFYPTKLMMTSEPLSENSFDSPTTRAFEHASDQLNQPRAEQASQQASERVSEQAPEHVLEQTSEEVLARASKEVSHQTLEQTSESPSKKPSVSPYSMPMSPPPSSPTASPSHEPIHASPPSSPTPHRGSDNATPLQWDSSPDSDDESQIEPARRRKHESRKSSFGAWCARLNPFARSDDEGSIRKSSPEPCRQNFVPSSSATSQSASSDVTPDSESPEHTPEKTVPSPSTTAASSSSTASSTPVAAASTSVPTPVLAPMPGATLTPSDLYVSGTAAYDIMTQVLLALREHARNVHCKIPQEFCARRTGLSSGLGLCVAKRALSEEKPLQQFAEALNEYLDACMSKHGVGVRSEVMTLRAFVFKLMGELQRTSAPASDSTDALESLPPKERAAASKASEVPSRRRGGSRKRATDTVAGAATGSSSVSDEPLAKRTRRASRRTSAYPK